MAYENLLLETDNHIALLTINRPEALNSLNPQTLDELSKMIVELEKSTEVKVVIITGAGEKAFVAGGDIAAMQPLMPMEARDVALKAQRLFNSIEFGNKIYLAAINGYALGGGCELAMACDIRIAVAGVKLGQPEVKLGIIPGWGGTQRLARLVGKGKAKELMMTGDMITAEEAQKIGLVNQIVKTSELLPEARKIATKIATKSQLAVRLIKEAVDNGLEMEINRSFTYEADLFGLCFAGQDQKEGMQAFLEKREATWKDR
ncbi:MAG: enoyl-CoA hydratase-related protein [Deltaproteobacteria bacterium]|nr:enoyl-CoA hydratase-related protein [Deltaproteobacteria bacterium]MCW9049081.1 enoyl-CoA hydratase-related protein [Deltaproteobacteria bacterium]